MVHKFCDAQFRDALLQTYLLCQNLLKQFQEQDRSFTVAGTTDAKHNELLHPLEQQRLLMCVKCLAGCVEFTGVGNEEHYLEMCNDVLKELRDVQASFSQVCFLLL